ncbi:MAG: transporter substrate-binding domain-containing protein [Colwellia sp.]|nr:transporter substrate-binding domain-containing protein [Colwellia sp.]
MKILLLVPIIFLLISLSAVNAATLNVVTESYPPFITIDGTKTSGILTKKVKAILAISQLQYTLNAYPWARSYQIASSQPNTLIYSIVKSAERSPYFHWYCPIYESSAVFAYKLAANSVDITSIAALRKTLVGTTRHGINHEFLKKYGFNVGENLDISATEDINLKKLINGRVDTVVQSIETMKYRLNKLEFKNIEITKGVAINNDKPTTHCMALNVNSDPLIINKISQAFQQYQKMVVLE